MASKSERIRVKTGYSNAKNEKKAAEELAKQIKQSDAKLTVLFVSSSFSLDDLAKHIHTSFGNGVIGCTTAGEITPVGYQSRSITGFSIASDELEPHFFFIPKIDHFRSERIQKIVDSIKEELATAKVHTPNIAAFGMLLIDGLSLMEERIIALLGNVANDLPIIGGSAGDDLQLDKTHILYDGQFISNAALFTLVTTTLPFLPIRSQHFQVTDERLVITRANPEKRIVYEINGRPAAEEYARINNMNLEKLKKLVYTTSPLIIRIGGEYFVRSIQKVNPDGSLTFFSAIEEGLVLRVAKRENLVDHLQKEFKEIESKISNIKLTIGCDCILRRLEVDDRKIHGQVNKIFNNFHVIGFNTYGEQYNAIHINQTFTGIVLGE